MYAESGSVQEGLRGLPLFKVSVGQVVRAVIQSPEVEVVGVHWFGRLFICPGGDCMACSYVPVRLLAFAVVQIEVGQSWRPFLLEMTGGAWSRCRLLSEMEGITAVQSLEVELRRPRPKGGIRVEPVSFGGTVSPVLATPERLVDALGVLFTLPRRAAEEQAAVWKERVRPAVATLCAGALAGVRGKA